MTLLRRLLALEYRLLEIIVQTSRWDGAIGSLNALSASRIPFGWVLDCHISSCTVDVLQEG